MAKETEDEIFDQFSQSNARQRSSSIYSIGGRMSEDEDHVGFAEDKLNFLQRDLTTRSVILRQSYLCDCGRPFSQSNPVAGTCQHGGGGCGAFLCSECIKIQTCHRCQRTFCPAHIRRSGPEKAYCTRCRPVELVSRGLKWFFDIGNERKEK